MRKRVHIALAVLLVILAGVIACQVLRLREPVYQGKPLSVWLIAYGRDEAVRQAGTNALPTLLRMLRAKDSASKVKLMDLAKRQHFIKIKYTPAEELNYRAYWAFEVLGAKAQSVVPALVEIANRNISRSSQYCAIQALGSIGPSAKEAAPSLLRWATNANAYVRCHEIIALGEIGTEPDRVVPVLLNALLDPQPVVRTCAVEALGLFGPNAKLAVPALVEFLNMRDSSTSDRWFATNVLKAIDPEAAAKAGVNRT